MFVYLKCECVRCVYVNTHMYAYTHEYKFPWSPGKGLGAEVMGGCELPDVGAGN